MTDKDKILKYLDYKGISKNKFYITTGLSVGFLDSGASLGVDKLRKIIDNYHDLNLEWVVMGVGEMIKDDLNVSNSSVRNSGKDNISEDEKWMTKYYDLQDKYTTLLEQHTELLQNKLREMLDIGDKSSKAV